MEEDGGASRSNAGLNVCLDPYGLDQLPDDVNLILPHVEALEVIACAERDNDL